ncbi:MAG: SIMPL domain-containing protein, partial [Nanoarchaeota archaeon]|nr:SIMPL domain-containing protein [Nanoarchaeota archaeon]
MKIYLIFGVLLVIALIGLTGCQQTNEENTLNAQGNSELTFDPDEAEVWAGISIVKDTAEEAQSEANKVV